MPREFPNPPSGDKAKKLYAGQGREVIAFEDESNPDKIIAYYKQGHVFQDNPETLKKLYQTLIIHEILTLLFPNNFPAWHDAGINKGGFVATVRTKAEGELKSKGASIQLEDIKKLFSKFNLPLSLDLAVPNIYFHGNLEKYVDSAGVFIRGNTDIEKLEKIMDVLKVPENIRQRVNKLGQRILVLAKAKV